MFLFFTTDKKLYRIEFKESNGYYKNLLKDIYESGSRLDLTNTNNGRYVNYDDNVCDVHALIISDYDGQDIVKVGKNYGEKGKVTGAPKKHDK